MALRFDGLWRACRSMRIRRVDSGNDQDRPQLKEPTAKPLKPILPPITGGNPQPASNKDVFRWRYSGLDPPVLANHANDPRWHTKCPSVSERSSWAFLMSPLTASATADSLFLVDARWPMRNR